MMLSQSSSDSSLHPRISVWQRLLLVLVGFFVTTCVSDRAKADLDTRTMYSIEWLVDESDTIVIVREPHKPDDGNPKVLRCIKGNPDAIEWPLTPMKTRWENYKNCVPPSNGPVRLLFIRGPSLLLQAVSLGRDKAIPHVDLKRYPLMYAPEPIFGISKTLYGVTQFGDLLLTESSLYSAIDARLKVVRVPIKVRSYELKPEDLGMTGSVSFVSGETIDEFPLEHSDELYSIVVPSDKHRRDYYLEQLTNGFVLEKIFSIYQLVGMMDTEAHAAIRAAVQCEDIELRYYEIATNQESNPWTSVRLAALNALERIDNHRDELIKKLKNPGARDKIEAIKDLALFDDPLAIEAIRRATQVATATPYMIMDKGTIIEAQTVQTVRETAAMALEQIEKDRSNRTNSR